jgi:hypothetical protein
VVLARWLKSVGNILVARRQMLVHASIDVSAYAHVAAKLRILSASGMDWQRWYAGKVASAVTAMTCAYGLKG